MLRRMIQPLLFLLARCSRNELIRQIEWLNAENQILRAKLGKKRIFLSPQEKSRLLQLGTAIGSDLQHFIKIVRYPTFLRWRREAKEGHVPKKLGRPRTAESIQQLIVRIGTETRWGYTRIMGELKKLGLRPPSRNTVKRILKAHQLDPGPKTGPDSWQGFLERHAQTLYECDFFSKRIWTKFGLRQCFVLVFLHLASRKVYVTKSTTKPDADWMQQQGKGFVQHLKATNQTATILLRDRDSVYSKTFDQTLKNAGIRVKKSSVRSPNLQAHIERFVQSIQQEALDHFLVCGEQHFDHLVGQYVEYYHTERPHQSLGNVPLSGTWPEASTENCPSTDDLVCHTRLGGLLKHYERKAA